ncbi:hypothetical protein PFICI_14416 [Pestalotiopsis fici W106-1]|uniref:XPG-I domain-containing protein n=1 Tax=Pestalotiopsis fici (strain W106-1 / CGMCC3.15140) TaxID=1229662 RepID=W3WHQ9_PESFW|nr:uncharacterized protein PFICI_14416 [Pestalotiopsis fici W106-1]ETS73470.1 hypothetical protein PFICI_14416 [Pestalotiopsis fici W106-1]
MGIEGLWDAVRDVTGGETLPLARLNAEWVSQKGRPMRIAVDTPLAIFQYKSATAQVSGYGGKNHPTRTLYFATLHILRTGVQPVFIFDGPNKPRKLGRLMQPQHVPSQSPARLSGRIEEREYDLNHISSLAKEMFDYLSIPWLIAAGEAEAECAALEQANIVDAVLTRDGDSLVFGSRFVLEKLVADNGTAMIRAFRMDDLEKKDGKPRGPDDIITRKHLLQLALMSGGDYDKGIRGCGAKVALQAARSGNSCYILFNKIGRGEDPSKWRWRWVHDLKQSLEAKGHHAVARSVPDVFPDPKIANYYLRPAVTSKDLLQSWAENVEWEKAINVSKLRAFTESNFDWRFAHLCGKFVRTLADTALVKELWLSHQKGNDGSNLFEAIVQAKTDAKMGDQLRLSFRP